MTSRLSIVVPTLGRPTLGRTLAFIVPQLAELDECIVVADMAGEPEAARGVVERLDHPHVRFAECDQVVPGVGNAPRRLGMQMAYGTHLAFMDDDDVYVPGALRLMRGAACERPVIFRMDATAYELGVLWAEPELTFANVGTPMFVVPNRHGFLAEWAPHTDVGGGSDYTFITGCCATLGDPVWREEIIAVVRPGPEWERLPAEQSDAA